jgi:FkbM family methyltransferase
MTFKFINGWKFPEYESRLCAIDINGNSIYTGLSHVEQALKFVKNFNTFLDIGANVGLISVPLCSKFKKVISIECIPETYECLRYNLEKFTNAVPMNFAVSNLTGRVKVAIPKSNGEFVSSGWASISQERQNMFEEKIQLDVECKTIDSLNLDSLDFLKIDVEQAEMMVIEGAINTIRKYKPVIEFENKRGENLHVLEFLEKIGYLSIPGRKRKSSECILYYSN